MTSGMHNSHRHCFRKMFKNGAAIYDGIPGVDVKQTDFKAEKIVFNKHQIYEKKEPPKPILKSQLSKKPIKKSQTQVKQTQTASSWAKTKETTISISQVRNFQVFLCHHALNQNAQPCVLLDGTIFGCVHAKAVLDQASRASRRKQADLNAITNKVLPQ